MTPAGHNGRVVFVGEAILTHATKLEKIKREVMINLDAHGCIALYWPDRFGNDESVFWPTSESPGLTPAPNYKLKFPNQAQENRYLKALKDARIEKPKPIRP